ncbi:MAG TPA: ABC transporter ATP-binding protein [Solirubrobacteraceae bacterium]|nr:ABC transporter ATP-binding protein [Solirubrobacteraceae bacterium]
MTDRPVVLEVRGVGKTFRIPTHRVDSFKERATHPFRRIEYREQHALRDVSFDVHEGEFLGIVGRNGSGKSTLLKIMSSIYRADRGRIRVAGRLAPFIELGVGFNPEMTSRDNVVLNGVMMGLGRREAQRRLDGVLDFAGLREFADLKLKNYSSGMMVRLAFAVMVEADADTMLVDEVLAVGDAEFAQKCMDVFQARRRAGRTLVLVTHDMTTVESMCDRALLLEAGEVAYLGDPQETAMRYYRVNFAREHASPDPDPAGAVWDVNVTPVDAWLENGAGERIENVEQGEPIGLRIVVEARHELVSPVFGIHFVDPQGNIVFGFDRPLAGGGAVASGGRVRIGGTVENRLLPGRYFVECYVARSREQGDYAMHRLRLLDFVVFGTSRGKGLVSVDADVAAEVEP